MSFLRALFFTASGLALCAPAFAQEKPLRHLVYTFHVSVTGSTAVKQSGIGVPGASTEGTSSQNEEDNGTIVADLVGFGKDNDLFFDVSETAHTRSAGVVRVVVRTNGDVSFNQAKVVNDEELAVLNFLGRGFLDMSKVDAANHWHESETSPGADVQKDYTIKGNDNGVLTLETTRVVKLGGATPLTVTTHGNVKYDSNNLVPKSVSTDSMSRTQSIASHTEVHTFVGLDLTEDSFAKKP